MEYTVSDAGLAFIARHEGFRAHVYDDGAGNSTVGYGHKLAQGESYPDGVTQGQAMELLARDVAAASAAVNACVTGAITQPQFDALVSFAFNVGVAAFAGSTLLRDVNGGDTTAAAAAFLAWDKITQGGAWVASPGLAARRSAESALFADGEY
jgi:lysozyme